MLRSTNIVVLTGDFRPAALQNFVRPSGKLPIHLLVEGTEEAQNLNNVKG